MTNLTSIFSISSNHNEFPEIYIYLDSRIKSCSPGSSKSNVTVREYPKQQLQRKKLPIEVEFYDEHGSPVTYRIQHDDNLNGTCNDFYPIQCQQGNDKKVSRLHKDGENFTLSSLSNELPTTTIQSATDCFRLGRTINSFPRQCLPSTLHFSSVEDSEPTYSSINSLSTNESIDVLDELPDDVHAITDDNEYNLIYEIHLNADN